MKPNRNKLAIYIGIIQLIVTIGAIPAGLSLIALPDGSGLGMSTEILSQSPFKNFYIPGLFLFVVNGVFNLMAAVISFRRKMYAGTVGLALGLFLIVWICIQVYFIGFIHFLQPLFFALGIIELILSWIIKQNNSAV